MGLNQTPGKVQEQGTTNLGIRLNIPANKLEEIRGILNSPDFEKSVEELDKKIEAMKNKIPVAVEKQWKEATKYFTKNKEPEHIAVVEHIQSLVKEKKITYKDTGKGTYEVNFNLPGCSMKIYMPEDEKIVDTSWNYIGWDGINFTKKETTKAKLQSEEGEKYLKEKEEKEHKRLMSEAEILGLGKALYPNGKEEEKILAIMQAIGFYGDMGLSDVTWQNCRFAVRCVRYGELCSIILLPGATDRCSLVYISTI